MPEKKQPIQSEVNNPNPVVSVRRVDWEKNILTRAMALLSLGAWIFIFFATGATGNSEFGFIAVLVLYIWVGLPAIMIGFIQIVISVIRWRRLTIFDKVLSSILLICLLFALFNGGGYMLKSVTIWCYNLIVEKLAIKTDNPDLCGKITSDILKEESCYRFFAVKRQDTNLCRDRDHDCFVELALILKDPFVCGKIPKHPIVDEIFMEDCYRKTLAQLWEGIENKEDVCHAIKNEYSREQCLDKVNIEDKENRMPAAQENPRQ